MKERGTLSGQTPVPYGGETSADEKRIGAAYHPWANQLRSRGGRSVAEKHASRRSEKEAKHVGQREGGRVGTVTLRLCRLVGLDIVHDVRVSHNVVRLPDCHYWTSDCGGSDPANPRVAIAIPEISTAGKSTPCQGNHCSQRHLGVRAAGPPSTSAIFLLSHAILAAPAPQRHLLLTHS